MNKVEKIQSLDQFRPIYTKMNVAYQHKTDELRLFWALLTYFALYLVLLWIDAQWPKLIKTKRELTTVIVCFLHHQTHVKSTRNITFIEVGLYRWGVRVLNHFASNFLCKFHQMNISHDHIQFVFKCFEASFSVLDFVTLYSI